MGLGAQSREDGHRSLVTPERVLSEYNEDLILILICYFNCLDSAHVRKGCGRSSSRL